MKNIFIQKNGMTLFEIVIATAIMGIIALGLLPLFASSMHFVTSAGERGKSVYDVKSKAEAALLQKNSDVSATGLVFEKNGAFWITAPGKVVTETDTLPNGTTVTIDVFQPTN